MAPVWNRRRVRCFDCNEFGHYARECQRRNEVFPAAEEADVDEGTTNVHYVEGSTCAYLPVRVNGRSTVALIDSGSEMSMAPASYVRPADIMGSSQLLRAANGTEIRVLGETTLRCQADGVSFQLPCLVTEQLSEIIFGLEFLEKQGAKWDFSNRSMRMFGRVFQLQRQPRMRRCRKIVVARETTVPAFSEKDVNTYVILPDLRTKPTTWATRPQVLTSGVVVAGTLIFPRCIDVAVRMLNPTNADIVVKKGVQCLTEDVTLMN